MKMAILGAGNIAGIMAATIKEMDDVVPYAVASRDEGRAQAFAQAHGFERSYGTYEELAADPQIDLIYIATPHSHHFEHAKLCLDYGKHVLCEKAFTVNTAQAEELFALAKKKKLMITEAMWSRYMPSRDIIDQILASGIIGQVTSLTANFGYALGHVERMREPALAAGTLLDLSIYPINFACMAFGSNFSGVTSAVVKNERGVDVCNSITLTYEDGKMAILHGTMQALLDRQGMIFGSKGYVEVRNICNCDEITVHGADRVLIKKYEIPKQISGYEYEVEACREALSKGELECPQMPHEETLRIMKLMDGLRNEWGIHYPCE